MLRWNDRQRAVLVEKLADLANLAAAGLLFGQAITGGRVSAWLGASGITLWLILIGMSMWLARK